MVLAEGTRLGQKPEEGKIKPEFQYNSTSAQIDVLGGEGVLIIQTSGKDEDNKVNPDVVAQFQCVVVGETSRKSVKVPAGSWHLIYNNVGKKPLTTEIVRSFGEPPVDQLERYVPFPAFEIVGQNGALALLPTLRVREIKRVDRGGIPYAQQDKRNRHILSENKI